jgi:phosphoribosyl 1,2-cyclic phosphodiesterase
MHLQILSSGSAGNATLVRAGETHLLVDAGLELDELEVRLDAARVRPKRIDHLVLTHGHLDHARAAGAFSSAHGAPVHCALSLMSNASVRGARTLSTFTIGRRYPLQGPYGDDGLVLTPVLIPHDAEPTVALRLEQRDRVAAIVTDMGRPDLGALAGLSGAHLLVLEFNHDPRMLADGPYSPNLKRRIGGPRGHLSNAEACAMLRMLAGPELHTLVLAHLSRVNNTPELARAAAERTLADLGRADVQVLIAEQDGVGPNLAV